LASVRTRGYSTTPEGGGRHAGRPYIVYFHGNDWHYTPSRQQYLMRAMSRYAPVIYLDNGRDRRGAITRHMVAPNVEVVRGVIPLIRTARRYNQERAAALYIRRAMAWINALGSPIFWLAENDIRPDRFINHDALIYDCIDPFLEDNEANRRREAVVLREARHVFATANLLLERCQGINPAATLLNNACDPAEYNFGGAPAGPPPPWLPPPGVPIAAYMGTVDSRVDLEVIDAAVLANPQVHFVLAGKVLAEQDRRWQNIVRRPNVTAPGTISVAAGHHVLAAANLCLVPFVANSENDGVNPVKMYVYALMGRPILGTDIRELRDRPLIAEVAGDATAFASAVTRLAAQGSDPPGERRRWEWAQANTWEQRAATAWSVVKALSM
jgi:hypothetical protein